MPCYRRFQNLAYVLALGLLLPSVASPQEDKVTADARLLFHQGRAALQAGRPESARLVLQRAYELRPTPQIGFNLGLAELEMGLFVQAATHMVLYVRQGKPSKNELDSFADAERNVAHLYFDVNVDGAEVFIDGRSIGETPFVFQPIYVLAGHHEVRARCEGYRGTRQEYDVVAGKRTDVRILLERETAPTASPERTDAGASSPDGGGTTFRPPPLAKPAGFHVDTRTIVVGSGAALTLAAGILAVVEATRASSATADAKAVPASTEPFACTQGQGPGCARLAELDKQHEDAIHLMRGALIGTAILGVATTAAWFFWPKTSRLQITPQMTPSTAGITISGVLQ